jgi:hypothetical protein
VWGEAGSRDWRLYQNKDGNVTVTADTGYTIVSVKFTYGYKDGGTLMNGTTAVSSNTVVSVNASTITLTVGNTGTKTNGQVKITTFNVIYQPIE